MTDSGRAYQVIRTRKRGFPHEGWQWEHVVDGFERAFGRAGVPLVEDPLPPRIADAIGRVIGRLPARAPRRKSTQDLRVLALMGPKPRLAFPLAYTPHRLALFIWDCWPPDDSRWNDIFTRLRPTFVFFSSRIARDRWAGRIPAQCLWIGEAIDDREYTPGPALADRAVDVLELGRPYEAFHRVAAPTLSREGFVHLHPTADRPHLFADTAELVSGLGSAKTLICYPASITHPRGRAAGVETMTHRFLEGVATRTLVVGKIPEEMVEMFGFRPGIDLPAEDVASKLPALIDSIETYQNLVDDSLGRLLRVATWDVRVRQILETVDNISPRVT